MSGRLVVKHARFILNMIVDDTSLQQPVEHLPALWKLANPKKASSSVLTYFNFFELLNLGGVGILESSFSFAFPSSHLSLSSHLVQLQGFCFFFFFFLVNGDSGYQTQFILLEKCYITD